LASCKNSFAYFFFFAFSIAIKRVDGSFVTPRYLIPIADRLQFKKRTSTIAPRFHLKSTLLEAHVAWKMLRMEHLFNEGVYFSYTQDLGAYHTKRVKRYIAALPELFGNYNNLTDSESVLYYRSQDNRVFYCEPVGILTFQRGKHPNYVWLDDILKDPQVKLDLTQLEKIERIFFEEVEQMPKEELHLIGTPQDQDDLFAKLENKPGYDCARYDAIVDEEKGIALWENNPMWCYKALQERRLRIGDKAFNKEMRCMPVRGEEGYVSLSQLTALISPRLKNYEITRPPKLKERTVVAGFDIGKKSHPSHLCVLAESRSHLLQIHSKFMDGWPYIEQIEYLKQAIEVFKIDKLLYDNTRSEFETSFEQGDLPPQMEGVAFTVKTKFAMAAELDKIITNKKIRLLDDPRQKRQILTVDCDLQAPETSDGHGDAFFSLCLAIKAWADASGILVTCI